MMEDDGGDGGADGGVPRRRKPEWKDDGWPPAMSDPWGGPGGASGKKRAGGEGGSSGDGDGEREGGPVVAAAADGASHTDESYSHSENARSYTANGSDDGSKVDGTSPAIIAQVSELLNDKILHSTLWVNRSWRLMVCMENSGVPIQHYV